MTNAPACQTVNKVGKKHPGQGNGPGCMDGQDPRLILGMDGNYAALTVAKNCSTCAFKSPAWRLRSEVASKTFVAAAPVSWAPWLTSSMLLLTSSVPCAASCTLRLISWVDAPCYSTAAEIELPISLIWLMVSEMPSIAVTAAPVAF